MLLLRYCETCKNSIMIKGFERVLVDKCLRLVLEMKKERKTYLHGFSGALDIVGDKVKRYGDYEVLYKCPYHVYKDKHTLEYYYTKNERCSFSPFHECLVDIPLRLEILVKRDGTYIYTIAHCVILM